MEQWKPIKKVVAGFIAAGIAYVAVQLGVDLGDEDVKEAALAVAGVLTAYLVRN